VKGANFHALTRTSSLYQWAPKGSTAPHLLKIQHFALYSFSLRYRVLQLLRFLLKNHDFVSTT